MNLPVNGQLLIKKLFLLLCCHFSSFIFGQSTHILKGIVLDATTNKAIPFVHFTYAKSKGFTSNEKGTFHIVDTVKSISVKVSCIGHQTKYVTLNTKKKNTIYLDRSIEKLNEVQLFYVDEKKELLKKVINNIPKNYPNKKETISGIIHEGVFVDSLFQDTIYNAEYTIKFNKLDYSKKHKTGNLSLTKGAAKFYKMKDSIPAIFYGVLHSVQGNDIVMRRDSPLHFSKLDDYKLTIKDTLFYDNLNLIKVDFRSKDFRGNLFIDSESYAIAKGEYWYEGKTSAIEKLRGFARKERYFSVHYDKYSDGKWRLKFISFLGRYTQKKKGETQTFFLKDNFIIRGFETTKVLIPYKNTLDFNTPGVSADDVALSFNLKNNESEKFQKKLKLFRFLSRLRFEFALEAYPLSIKPFTFHLSFLENSITNSIDNSKTYLAFRNSYFYDLNKTLQMELNFTSSISNNTLSAYSLGLSKKINLDPLGKLTILMGANFGYRRIFNHPVEHSFEGSLTVRNKSFNKGAVDIYVGQKEYYFSPKISLNHRLSNRLSLKLTTSYFSPINTTPSVLIKESKGLFKKSVFYSTNSKSIVEHNFSYGMGLVLNL